MTTEAGCDSVALLNTTEELWYTDDETSVDEDANVLAVREVIGASIDDVSALELV
jgi:hypothetical protein